MGLPGLFHGLQEHVNEVARSISWASGTCVWGEGDLLKHTFQRMKTKSLFVSSS